MSFGAKTVDVAFHNRLKEENKALKDQVKRQGLEIKKLGIMFEKKKSREQSKLVINKQVEEI